jgi:hypothetical protein
MLTCHLCQKNALEIKCNHCDAFFGNLNEYLQSHGVPDMVRCDANDILPLAVKMREGDISGKKVIIQFMPGMPKSWQWRIVFPLGRDVVIDMVGWAMSDLEAQHMALDALTALNKGKIVE